MYLNSPRIRNPVRIDCFGFTGHRRAGLAVFELRYVNDTGTLTAAANLHRVINLYMLFTFLSPVDPRCGFSEFRHIHGRKKKILTSLLLQQIKKIKQRIIVVSLESETKRNEQGDRLGNDQDVANRFCRVSPPVNLAYSCDSYRTNRSAFHSACFVHHGKQLDKKDRLTTGQIVSVHH